MICRLDPRTLKIEGTEIVDTFAEAFSMRYTRLIVTAINDRWLTAAMNEFCGYGSSVIGCDAEVGVERWLAANQTPDQRVGASVMAFGFSTEALSKAIANRTGQSLMTCPTTAVFDGMLDDANRINQAPNDQSPNDQSPNDESDETSPPKLEKFELGKHLRFFGDGYQKSKLVGDRRFWRIPVMDGEFIIEESAGVAKGVAGGNFLIQSTNQSAGLAAAERAIDAIDQIEGVITPFPGGVVRSGSKVGSQYPALRASTSHTYCPTLRGRVETDLLDGVNCVYEIVIDGTSFESVANATRTGIESAAGDGIIGISAGNYGGKLGKHHFHLHKLFQE